MTNHPASADRLQPLLSAMLDGQLTDGQIAELHVYCAPIPRPADNTSVKSTPTSCCNG